MRYCVAMFYIAEINYRLVSIAYTYVILIGSGLGKDIQMAMHPSVIAEAYGRFQRGDLEGARAMLTPLLHAPGLSMQAHHLMGLVEKKSGHLTNAEHHLRTALEGSEETDEIMNSLGGVLFARHDFDGASEIYEKLLAKGVQSLDVLYNSILALIELGHWTNAQARTEKALKMAPNDKRFHYLRGKVLNNSGNHTGAEQSLRRAIQLDTGYFQALYLLSHLKREQQSYKDALTLVKLCLNIKPTSFEAWAAAGGICYSLGDVNAACHAYGQALSINPGHIETHQHFNKMLWEYGRTEEYARSFAVARHLGVNTVALTVAEVDALEKGGDLDGAERVLANGLTGFSKCDPLVHRQARLKAGRGDRTGAEGLLKDWLDDQDCAMPEMLLDHACFAIHEGHYDEALESLGRLEKLSPYDQQMWAYRGLAWRLSEDRDLQEREKFLNDYDRFVQTIMIEPPDGYDGLDGFLSALGGSLRTLHNSQQAPLDQTLMGGTQSLGKLLDGPDPVIQAFKGALRRAVSSYLDGLSDDPEHPLLSRKTEQFEFSASWSVRLGKGGYHINHVHPLGWISSAFYVAIDDGLIGDEIDKDGWICFGHSGLNLDGDREQIGKWVKPKPGMLALFPSYMWHGTKPIKKDGERMTAPFDVVPVVN